MENTNKNVRITLVIVVILIVLINFIPFGKFVLYPFQLFTTFIHELFHAVVTLLTGGQHISIMINPDTSGLTRSSGGFRLLVIPAGYIGTTILGGILISLLVKYRIDKFIVAFFGGLLILTTIVFGLTSLFSIITGISLGIVLLLLAYNLKGKVLFFFALFLSALLCLNSLGDLKDLLFLSAFSGTTTDAQIMSQTILPLPAIVWAIIFALISVFFLILSLKDIFKVHIEDKL